MTGEQNKPIQILLVEDSDDDTDLIKFQFQKEGLNAHFTRVETEVEFRKALSEQTWDLILSDYLLVEFDGLSALNIINEFYIDIPFILISGKVGEKFAVQAMKSGAHDYIIKDNLNRLIPAIRRELKEVSIRREHRKNQEERKLLFNVLESSMNEIYIFNIETLRFIYANKKALKNLGYSEEELGKYTAAEINPNIADEEYKTVIKSLEETENLNNIFVTEHLRSDGTRYPIEVQYTLIEHNNTTSAAMIGIDLTNQKRDQNIIRQQKKLAIELERQSEYKSAFLANMSHELRTPLNSIILLSDLMQKNREDNLSRDQIHKLGVIKESGDHLLELINQVLDLSKVEAGKLQFELSRVKLNDFVKHLKQTFEPIAEKKELNFEVISENSGNLPESIVSDELRLRQTLKNLLSNSFKFTKSGSVTLSIFEAENSQIGFRVKDTGIGIPKNKQKLIFKSFQQADSSTSRNYGGTGLGLSISKQLTESLGGSITVKSKTNEGTEFTVLLPLDSSAFISENLQSQDIHIGNGIQLQKKSEKNTLPEFETPQPKNDSVSNGTVLFYSTDQEFCNSVLEAANSQNQQIILAQNSERLWEIAGSEEVVSIIIDVTAGDYSGWTILKQFSGKPNIPVALLLNRTSETLHPLLSNYCSTFIKPLNYNEILKLVNLHHTGTESGRIGSILLVDDSEIHSEVMVEFFSESVRKCDTAFTANEAYEMASEEPYDIVVLDLTLPDISGKEVLKKLKTDSAFHNPDVIIYSGRQLKPEEKKELQTQSDGVITKNIGSINKLKDRINTLLSKRHSSHSTLDTKYLPYSNPSKTPNSHLLIADDDYNSCLSLSSHLEDLGHKISYVENGKEAIDWLKQNPHKADAVMLDIMMPVMDGYETLEVIRNDLGMTNLPVFALTAKAMKGDREKCIERGATDYISKPIDLNRIKILLQIWL